jgi:hypothetical protein
MGLTGVNLNLRDSPKAISKRTRTPLIFQNK